MPPIVNLKKCKYICKVKGEPDSVGLFGTLGDCRLTLFINGNT